MAGRDEPRALPRLRVATYSDATTLGGAEHALRHLVQRLGSHVDVAVVGTDAAVVRFLVDARPGASAWLLPSVRDKWDVTAILAHVRVLARLRPHILHASLRTPWTCQYALLAALLTPGVNAIATERCPLPSDQRVQRWLKRVVSRRLAAHVAVSERAARLVESYAELLPGSVRVIYSGVPDVSLPPMPRLTSGRVVGSLGRLDELKGYDVLVRALPALPHVTAVLVGDGEARPRLERLARELGVMERLVITGWENCARAYLATFDVFVLPSRFEAFGLSILEAMLAELPVVASNVGGIPELVVHGDTGLLVPPDDAEALAEAIREALEPETAARLGRQGRERAVARFGVDAMVHAYEALYEEVTRGEARPRRPAPASPT